jgi:CheY-like chemotaxis protein
LDDALHFYNEADPLVQESPDHALKGAFHNQLALLYRNLYTSERRTEYIDRALIEFAAASYHFEEAGHVRYQARVENNLGELFSVIGRFKEATAHLDRARRLFSQLNDKGSIAQVDETRARLLLSQGLLKEADRVVRSSVKTLEQGDERALLAEALTTHGVVLARLGNYGRSRTALERAIQVAETTGDLEGAGRARLTIIEELANNISPKELVSIYRSAIELLKRSQDPSTGKRLILCAEKLLDALGHSGPRDQRSPEQTWEGFSFKQHVHECERAVIERALLDAGGSVTKAAHLLGFKHHHSLISLINIRHKELLKARSAARKRRRHLFSEPRKMKAAKKLGESNPTTPASQISILHVEDNQAVAQLIDETLSEEGMRVSSCADGLTALELLKSDERYDVVIVDKDLPDLSGLELVLRLRSIANRRHTPVMMLSGDDCEKEAWRAGVDAFLLKPKGVDKVASTIDRLLLGRPRKGSKFSEGEKHRKQ